MHYTWVTATDMRTYKRRYRILDDLEDHPKTTRDIAQLHKVSENTVRRHLQELRREGIIIRYNPSDKRYYTSRHIMKEEERRKRRMIPSKTLADFKISISPTDHDVRMVPRECQPLVGSIKTYAGANTIWMVQVLKRTSFGGEECFETRRDVHSSTMKHVCYSYFYDQVTDGGRYLIGDVQTNSSVPTLPIVCYHRPKELIHPLPLTDGQSWTDMHREEQPFFSLRKATPTGTKTFCETRGNFKVNIQNRTHYCLRILRATKDNLSELFLDENGVEILIRSYASEDSPGWKADFKSMPSIKLCERVYHRRGEGVALAEFRIAG